MAIAVDYKERVSTLGMEPPSKACGSFASWLRRLFYGRAADKPNRIRGSISGKEMEANTKRSRRFSHFVITPAILW